MVNEDSHSTDLSVSSEESHSTILLAHFIFSVLIEDKVIWQRWLRRKIARLEKVRNVTFVSFSICSLYILASNQKQFLFFRATFEQPFEKLENLEQLIESPRVTTPAKFGLVARYSFSGSIPPKFGHKLRRHKQRFGKIATTIVLDKDENLLRSELQ